MIYQLKEEEKNLKYTFSKAIKLMEYFLMLKQYEKNK